MIIDIVLLRARLKEGRFLWRKKVGLEHTCILALEYFICTLKITINFSVVITYYCYYYRPFHQR